MKVAFGCDHGGFEMKEEVIAHIRAMGHEVMDCGTMSADSCDYPDFGVLICGTGIGISISANKVPGVRAAVCSEPFTARLCRQHNDANIIAFGARVVGIGLAKLILDEFFTAQYMADQPRHVNRVKKINDIDARYR